MQCLCLVGCGVASATRGVNTVATYKYVLHVGYLYRCRSNSGLGRQWVTSACEGRSPVSSCWSHPSHPLSAANSIFWVARPGLTAAGLSLLADHLCSQCAAVHAGMSPLFRASPKPTTYIATVELVARAWSRVVRNLFELGHGQTLLMDDGLACRPRAVCDSNIKHHVLLACRPAIGLPLFFTWGPQHLT